MQQSPVAQEKKSKSSHVWWNCGEFVDPNTHRCYMKPIVFQQDDDQEDPEDQQEQGKQKENRRKRRRVAEELIDHDVEEGDEQEGQEYLFFDIKSRQDEGRHIANLLIVQDETGFEMVFKGDDCVDQFGTWLLDGTHEGAIVIAHNLRGYDGFLLCE